MHDKGTAPRRILTAAEAERRSDLLGALRDVLDMRGIPSVLARRRTIVLRGKAPFGPSGLTDPELHVLASAHLIITTDGAEYRSSDGWTHTTSDVTGAATLVHRSAGSEVSEEIAADRPPDLDMGC